MYLSSPSTSFLSVLFPVKTGNGVCYSLNFRNLGKAFILWDHFVKKKSYDKKKPYEQWMCKETNSFISSLRMEWNEVQFLLGPCSFSFCARCSIKDRQGKVLFLRS